MKKIVISTLLVMAFGWTFGSNNSLNDLKNILLNEAENIKEETIELRRDFHQNPELSNREFRTASVIADYLTKLGLEVQTKVAHTGVVALLRGTKEFPVIGLRADIDALPVFERNELPFKSTATGTYNGKEVPVMHACGHDTHIAIMLSVAKILSQHKDKIPGTIKFVFQPAEEGPPKGEEGGAELMVKEGVLENPKVDVMFGLHISANLAINKIAYRPGGIMAAVDDFKIVIKGRQAHGAAPWSSIDPIVTASQMIMGFQTIVSRNMEITNNPAVVTVGSIHGGVRSNIIPEKVELVGTLRTLDRRDTEIVRQRVREIAENTAKAMGASVEVYIPYSVTYPVTYNDPKLTAQMLPSLQSIAGNENVVNVPPRTGAEDFSFYALKVPSMFYFLGGRDPEKKANEVASHHTPGFYIDERGLNLGVKSFISLVVDYLDAP